MYLLLLLLLLLFNSKALFTYDLKYVPNRSKLCLMSTAVMHALIEL